VLNLVLILSSLWFEKELKGRRFLPPPPSKLSMCALLQIMNSNEKQEINELEQNLLILTTLSYSSLPR
jgi:hypothetical protein